MPLHPLGHIVPAVAFAGLVLAGGAAGTASDTPIAAAPAAPAGTQLSAVADLGRKMFYDAALSGSGKMSCASCHSPANHYAPDNDRAVQLGGPDLDRPGLRATPTLTYKNRTRPFSIGPENPANEAFEASPMSVASGQRQPTSAAPAGGALVADLSGRPKSAATAAQAAAAVVPEGGLFWDGRADSLEDQTMGPLMSPFEMANASKHALYETIKARYGETIAALFGQSVLADTDQTISEAGFALARYQVEDPAFHAFTSKYDAYLRGQVRLSPAEARGLKLFDDPKKGNCASCHLDKMTSDGRFPVFTDDEYEALGAPRNPRIPANRDPDYFDLGICGPLRTDTYAHQAKNCGLFKTPTLRNVATRRVFFHNGVFHSLRDVLHFYVERDTNPGRIYPEDKDGRIETFNDLPAAYRGNIDTIDAPLDRHPGDRPALDAQEINDVIAFLKTLTDGYSP